PGAPASLADQTGGGQSPNSNSPGFMSILGGTTNSTPPPAWSSVATYNKNDIVSYLGHYYQANVDNTSSATTPDQNSQWSNVDAQFETSGRISSSIGSSTAGCPPGGTSASGQRGCRQT